MYIQELACFHSVDHLLMDDIYSLSAYKYVLLNDRIMFWEMYLYL